MAGAVGPWTSGEGPSQSPRKLPPSLPKWAALQSLQARRPRSPGEEPPRPVSPSWSDQEARGRPWRPGWGSVRTEGSLPALGGPALLPLLAGVHSGGSWAQDAWAAGHQQTSSFLPAWRRVWGSFRSSLGVHWPCGLLQQELGPSSSSGTWRAPAGRGGVAPALSRSAPPPPGLMPAPSKGSLCSVASSCLLSWVRLRGKFTESSWRWPQFFGPRKGREALSWDAGRPAVAPPAPPPAPPAGPDRPDEVREARLVFRGRGALGAQLNHGCRPRGRGRPLPLRPGGPAGRSDVRPGSGRAEGR